MFTRIHLNHWRQFNETLIDFDPRMTVLTGENGTGKTTILNILSKHFGWNLSMVSTPVSKSKSRVKQIWSDIWEKIFPDPNVQQNKFQIGTIHYSEEQQCNLIAPPMIEQAQYNLQYENMQPVLGLHIPSHRPAFTYHRVSSIPTDPKTSQQQYQEYQQILQQLYQAESSQNPGGVLKQSLIALAVFGYGNPAVDEKPEYRKMFEEFQEVLRVLLPKSLGFHRLEIRIPDIVFITDSGDFSLDASSGGIGALLGIAWQIYMYGVDKDNFVVTIDEPESHLHPSMQRELLPNLFLAFPKAQFIVATHSPFIVTSTPKARVYALMFNEDHRVDSLNLETADLSGTANETLREILGVPISVPIWVEQRFKEIIQKYRGIELTSEKLMELKQELVSHELGFMLPEAIDNIKR